MLQYSCERMILVKKYLVLGKSNIVNHCCDDKSDVIICDYAKEYYNLKSFVKNNEQFKELGITDIKDTYIVNYKTGEVYNETQKTTNDGNILYICAVE